MINEENFVPVEEFSRTSNIDENEVIKEIRDGDRIGRVIDGKWYVYVDDNKQEEKGGSTRLGEFNNLPGIDPNLISLFSKITRIIGVVVSLMFILWGLYGKWDYRYTPFEAFAISIGFSYSNMSFGVVIITGSALLFGWMFRFYIGNVFTLLFVKIYDGFKFIFRKI